MNKGDIIVKDFNKNLRCFPVFEKIIVVITTMNVLTEVGTI